MWHLLLFDSSFVAVLLEPLAGPGASQLVLAGQADSRQATRISELAAEAFANWRENNHPGWSVVEQDSDMFLSQLMHFKVLCCAALCYAATCFALKTNCKLAGNQPRWLVSGGARQLHVFGLADVVQGALLCQYVLCHAVPCCAAFDMHAKTPVLQ